MSWERIEQIIADDQEGVANPFADTIGAGGVFPDDLDRTDPGSRHVKLPPISGGGGDGWEEQHGRLRSTYVQLDLLQTGAVFGLDHLETVALASEPIGRMLISDGAEVIMLNKRFFLTHAENNTMLRVENSVREYLSEAEASESVKEHDTWQQYKRQLITKTCQRITPRPNSQAVAPARV